MEVPHWKPTGANTSAGQGDSDWEMGEAFLRYGGNKGSKSREAVGLGDGGAGGYLSSYITSPKYRSY